MADAHLYEGPITMTRKGFGFFSVGEDSEDLLIPPQWTGHALTGDIVKVEPAGTYRDPSGRMPAREAGKVVEIISRARETFVGALVEENGKTFLTSDYKKMHVPIEVRDVKGAQLGYKVLVRMKGWEANTPYPWGVVEEVIGKAGVHETEMRALALGQGFSSDFPPGVEKDAAYLKEHGRAMLAEEAEREGARRDFRNAPTCTIDPADAKDFDDALSVRKLDGGNIEVGVHIADVSFFVRPGSALDTEARGRATSVYLVDRTIPMLPEILSNDLCSLNPDQDRLAVSAVFTLDAEANIVAEWFGETVIHSNKRFTYENAQEVLDAGSGTMHGELSLLLNLSKKIRARRQAKGAIEFDTPEVKVKLDEQGAPIAVVLKERKATNLLIEDFMLLANEAVAKHLATLTRNGGSNFSSLYRIHDAPDADRIENLANLLRVMGYHLKITGGNVTGAELNKLLEAVKGKPEEYLVKTATLRSMSKAVYATRNIGHFGLAFEYYTHFTSPIRRYPDLVIHRLIKAHAGGAPITAAEMREFDSLALHASEREVAASDAERDSIKMKQVEFLAGRIGEEFDAVISGVTERGLYVEEQTTHADGMIRIHDVGDDYFEYDEKHYRLLGRRTKKAYQLGDPIRVRLSAARVAEKELDFVPVV